MADPVSSSSASGASPEPAASGASGPEQSSNSSKSFIEELKNTTVTNPSTGEEINAFDAFVMNLAMKTAQDMQARSAELNEAMKKAGESKD